MVVACRQLVPRVLLWYPFLRTCQLQPLTYLLPLLLPWSSLQALCGW